MLKGVAMPEFMDVFGLCSGLALVTDRAPAAHKTRRLAPAIVQHRTNRDYS